MKPNVLLPDEITGEMLLNQNIKEIPTLLEPLLPKSGLVCLAGSSDTGKSAFLRQLAMSVCAGLKIFLGMRLNAEHHSAIYVSTEDDETANAYLMARQNMDLRISPTALRGLRFLFDSEDVVADLDKRLTHRPADLVVVDCFSDLYTGSMNEGNQVRQFLMQYSQLAIRHKCLVIFLHHCGKRTEMFMPSKHNLLVARHLRQRCVWCSNCVATLQMSPISTCVASRVTICLLITSRSPSSCSSPII